MRQIVAILLVAVALGAGATAGVAAPSGTVVVPSGQVEGRNYADWLGIFWRQALSEEPAPTCAMARGVLLTLAGPTGPRTAYACSAAPGTTVYLNGPSSACSNVEEPPFYGGTREELKTCAKKQYDGFVERLSYSIDGRRVKRPERWTVASHPFHVHLPEKNDLGTEKDRARLAAFGSGLLVSGLAPGVHVLKGRIDAGDLKATLIYHITIG